MQHLHLCLQEKLMPVSSLGTFQRAAQRDEVVKRADAVLREVSLYPVQQAKQLQQQRQMEQHEHAVAAAAAPVESTGSSGTLHQRWKSQDVGSCL
jgi:hypothetical protein